MRIHLPQRSGAILSVEFLFLLPLLILFVLALVEISMLITVETRLASVSRAGARIASLGGDEAEIRVVVEQVFGPAQSSEVTLEVDFVNDSDEPGQPVKVSASASAETLVPNYLRFIGFDLKDRWLTAQTVMTVE